MLEFLERQQRLTVNQWKIISAAILGDMLDFFDFFLIGYVLAFIVGEWKLSFLESGMILLAAGIGAITTGRMVMADEPVRIASRIDRLSHYYPGVRPVSPSALRAGDPAAVAAAGAILERVINTPDFVDVRYLEAGTRASRAVGRVDIRDHAGRVGGRLHDPDHRRRGPRRDRARHRAALAADAAHLVAVVEEDEAVTLELSVVEGLLHDSVGGHSPGSTRTFR